jgi:hypothetical protein
MDECSLTSKDTDGEQRRATHNNTRTHRFATQRATRGLAQARVVRPPARQGKASSSAAGRLRADAAGTSPPAISLAEHRVEFRVGPDLPDLLHAAAGDGDLGSPPQRLLA